MGLTKQYLRFASQGVFGIVANKSCNAVYVKSDRLVATAGVHQVELLDLKLQRKKAFLTCESPVVFLQPSPSQDLLAVGHLDGAVSIFELENIFVDNDDPTPASQAKVTFQGHTSEVTCLHWDDAMQIVSGSKDTKVIVWDCVSETGRMKLAAHRGMITQAKFWKESTYVVSSSTDSTIRIWDTRTRQNVHVIPCNVQVWDFDFFGDLIIAAESHIRIFEVLEDPESAAEWETNELGTLLREGRDRVSHVKVFQNQQLLVTGIKSPIIETFHLYSGQDLIRKRTKRLKKHPDQDPSFILKDYFKRGLSVKATESKIKSIDIFSAANILEILVCLPSNQLELIKFDCKDSISKQVNGKEIQMAPSTCFPFDGHRKIIRAVCISSDKTAILTASSDSFKVWNRNRLECILTIKNEQESLVVCAQFCPGDRHFIAGTTDGRLILGDIAASTVIRDETFSSETIWSIDVFSNNTGFVSSMGSVIRLFEFTMINGQLNFEFKRQMDVKEVILCAKITPNMKFLCTGLLDQTVKVFYLDTLKHHITMYGHSLPVVGIDISSDSTLLASCSGDKTVKIWGLDFGDCHTSMIHTEGLVGVSFFHNTHLLVSVAKDTLNIYDADIHSRVQTIKSHAEGGATCMATRGFYIVSSGRDQTIRLFNRTKEILVLEDEVEEEREKELDKGALEDNPQLAALKSSESEKCADKVIEAVDVFKNSELSSDSPLLLAYSAKDRVDFVYKMLSSIKASELEQSIMLLPVVYVRGLVPVLKSILERYPYCVELTLKCLSYLMKFHWATLSGSDKECLREFGKLAETRLQALIDITGFNMAGLNFIANAESDKTRVQMLKEKFENRKRKKKRKDKALKRALLTV